MLASLDHFLAIFETNTFLISIYFLLIIQGNRVGIVVLYKESVILPCLFFSPGFQSNFGTIPKILDAKYTRYANTALPTLLLTLTSEN